MPTPTAVVFDLDETLCTTHQDEASLFRAAFEAADVAPFGSVDELWAALDGPPGPDDEQSYLASGFRRLAAQYGHRRVPADDLAGGLLAAVDRSAVSFLPGAESALAIAREHGPVGIMTNGPRHRQEPKVEALALADRVDATVYAGDLPRRKPHPEPFAAVCDAIETPARSTVYVGDSLSYDVAGAHGAGLLAAWYPGGDDGPGEYRPDYVLDGLDDLGDVLDGADERGEPL
jgi:putative hydrolase of the HAD superfamily